MFLLCWALASLKVYLLYPLGTSSWGTAGCDDANVPGGENSALNFYYKTKIEKVADAGMTSHKCEVFHSCDRLETRTNGARKLDLVLIN
ncbi:hypothetical protein ACET3Z_024070 [Daucus carota]